MDGTAGRPRRYFEIVGWHENQTMKLPGAPWVKLHAELLDDEDFEALDEKTKLLYFYLLMHGAVAGRALFPDDPKWLFRKISLLRDFPDLEPLAKPRVRHGLPFGYIRWCTIDGGPWRAPAEPQDAEGAAAAPLATSSLPAPPEAAAGPLPGPAQLQPTPSSDPGMEPAAGDAKVESRFQAENREHLPEKSKTDILIEQSRAEQSRAEQSRAEQSRAEQGKTADGFPQHSLAAQAAEGECREGKSQPEPAEGQGTPVRVMQCDRPLPPIAAVPFVPLGADGPYGKGPGAMPLGQSIGGRAGDARMLGQCWPKGIEALLDPLKGEWVAAVYQRLGFPWPIDSAIGRREAGCFASLYDGLMTTRLPDPIKRLILAHDLDWAEKNGRQKRSRKRGAVFAAVHQKRLRQYLSRDGPRR